MKIFFSLIMFASCIFCENLFSNEILINEDRNDNSNYVISNEESNTTNVLSGNTNNPTKIDNNQGIHQQIKSSKTCCWKPRKFLVEIKGAYLYYQDKAFRKIFDNGNFLLTVGFDSKIYKNLHGWLDVGYLHGKGKPWIIGESEFIIDDYDTSINFVPLSFGLKYQHKIIRNVSLYAKIGPNWFYINNKNEYPYVDRKISKNGWGFTTGIGSIIDLNKCIALDLFIDYLYCKKSFLDCNSNKKVFLGGVAFGAGLGYKF